MPRVSEEELKGIIETRADESVWSYIEDANTLVNETLDIATFTEARLKLIEKYLAAHLWVVAAEKGGLTLERALDAVNEYKVQEGTGLSATRFGQQVMAFDTSGALHKVLSYAKKAQLRVV